MRRRQRQGAGAPEAAGKDGTKAPADASIEYKTFFRNCLILAVVIVGPYFAFLAWRWLRLQSGLERRVVTMDDPRQVLIVGTQSSGTVATSQALNELGIEICHECTDALNHYARDGTLGWAQAIRFLPRVDWADEKQLKKFAEMCRSPRFNLIHSTQFEPSFNCSYRVSWDRCWQTACLEVFKRQLGCAHSPEGCSRPPAFRKTLLQVRHPVHTIASLIVKYCTDAKEGTLPHPDKLAVLDGFLPRIDWRSMEGGCIQVFTHYWCEYNENVLEAVGPENFYRVEDTQPCEIATMAGFFSADNQFFPRANLGHLQLQCGKRNAAAQAEHQGGMTAHREHGTVNRGNTGKLKLLWQRDFVDNKLMPRELVKRVEHLAKIFGYTL